MKQNLQVFWPRNLSLLVLAMVVLVSCTSGNLAGPKDTTIYIDAGDVSTGRITLIPSGTAPAYKNKKVDWRITPNATTVKSFRIVKKGSSEEIFDSSDRPPSSQGRNSGGRVKGSAQTGTIYDYTIEWFDYDDSTQMHSDDPKIAIKPTGFNIVNVIVGVAVVALALLTFVFVRRRNSNRA